MSSTGLKLRVYVEVTPKLVLVLRSKQPARRGELALVDGLYYHEMPEIDA